MLRPLLLLALVLLSGCASPAQKATAGPPPLPGEFLEHAAPLHVGMHWEMRTQDGRWLNSTVEAIEHKAGVEAYRVVERRSRDPDVQTTWYAASDRRVVAARTGSVEVESSCTPANGYPFRNMTTRCTHRSSGRVVGVTDLDVVAGPLTLVEVAARQEWVYPVTFVPRTGNGTSIWFAPALGHPVRFVDGAGNDFRLA